MRTCYLSEVYKKKKGILTKSGGGASSSNQAVNGTVSKGRVGLGQVGLGRGQGRGRGRGQDQGHGFMGRVLLISKEEEQLEPQTRHRPMFQQ